MGIEESKEVVIDVDTATLKANIKKVRAKILAIDSELHNLISSCSVLDREVEDGIDLNTVLSNQSNALRGLLTVK